MRLVAREPFELCEDILERLTASDFGGDEASWRINWIAGVATLRTVGQVLDKVDKITSPQLAAVIDSRWRGLKADKSAYPIFWDFIDKERDAILKEFRFSVEEVPLALAATAEGPLDLADDLADMQWELLAVDGTAEATQQFSDAIEFWRSYLEDIEAASIQPQQR